jgi:hypothetical protein
MIFAKYLPHLYQGADHKGHRTYNMGGGGGGGPTQSTVTQSSVPEYGCALRPRRFLVRVCKSILTQPQER